MNPPEPAAPPAIDAAPVAPVRAAGFELFVIDSRGAQHRLRVTDVSVAPHDAPLAARDAPVRAEPPNAPLAARDAPEIRRIAAAMGSGDGIDK